MRILSALITGASSGIGAEFARQLAARGANLILTARREERLVSLARELSDKHSIEAVVVVADLATKQGVESVVNAIRARPEIDLLINNAGFGVPGSFHSGCFNNELDMLQVHVVAVNHLTRAALEGMTARRRGAVINVASIAGFGPTPGSVNYNATKAYLIRFSQGLSLELKPLGITVQAFCPGFTHTDFHLTPELRDDFDKGAFPRWMWMKASRAVSRSLRGLDQGKVVVIPWMLYNVISWLLGTRLYYALAGMVAGKGWSPKTNLK